MTNYDIADYFSLLSKLMDIHGENAFRSKSYSIAAYHIEKLPKEAAEMDDAELYSMKGIGEGTGQRIREILATGKLEALEKMIAKTPVGILDMMQIKGLGPKKIALVWKEMGIESIGELEYACNENRLVNYKGFGAKTQEAILKNILFIRANQNFRLWAEMEEPSKMLIANLLKANSGKQFAITGAMRRQSPTIEFMDIVTDADASTLKAQFAANVDAAFEETADTLIAKVKEAQDIRFHLTDTQSFYKKLFLTTGSDKFVAAFNQHYTMPDAVTAEMDIFTHNNLQYIPPAMREKDHVLTRAATNNLPELIQPTDIKGIIHSHSTWSDGADKLEKMATEAQKRGFEYLVISDHSQSAFYANGLTPERIAEQHAEIDALNAKLAPFKIFKSIESDILNDGSLDYSNNVLATFDLVIASVHSNLKMTQEKAMERVLTAIRNPYTTILGHPTGRLLLSREGYQLDHKVIIDECVKHNVVIEINAHPRRLDLDWQWIEYAMEAGALLSIDPDSHAAVAFHDVHYGVMAAQKGGLTKQRNLSSFSLAEFEVFLAKNKKV